jgi:hypothetical protein
MATEMHRLMAAPTVGRRRFLVLAGGMAASAILAACGGSATDTPQPSTPTTAAPTTAAASAATSPTTAAGSATAATRPAGSATTGATAAGTTTAGSATTGTTAASSATTGTRPAGTTTTGTSVTGTTLPAGSATTGTRPAGSAVSGTTAAGSATTGTTTAGTGPVLAIDASEYAFKTLGSIPAGITTVQLRNVGKEKHEAQFIKLNPGVTIDQVIAALQQQGPPPDLFSFEGGPAEVIASKTAEVILDLSQGQYVLLCFISAPDGQPHVAKGMLLQLTVNAATGTAGTLPAGKGTIALGAPNGFDLPATMPAGKSTYRLTNQDTANPRAFLYGMIPADKTIDDVNKALQDTEAPEPDWFTPLGGMDGLKPGGSGGVTLDLTSGKYAAVDVPFGDAKPFGRVFTVS